MTFDEIVDLAVDENFEVFIDHRGDIGTVKGRDAFEQRLIIHLTEELRPLIGRQNVDRESITSLAENRIENITDAIDGLEEVVAFSATFPPDRQKVLEIEVIYDTGDDLTFDIEA